MLGQVARRRATAALVLVGLLAHGTGFTAPVAHGRDLHPTRPGSARLLTEQLSLQEWARPQARPRPALALAAMQFPTNAPGAPLTPTQPEADPGVFGKWWFWAAVGAVVATTVIILVVATAGSDGPSTQLGNMEIFK